MIFLVRHGETDWNLFKRINGITDTFLNRTGIAQSKLRAENLKNVHFDACYCSPQTRARQTCEIIYSGSIVFDERLIEINAGEFEGADETEPDVMKQTWEAVVTGDKGTERWTDFLARNCDFGDMVSKEHPGENVLIVTHAMNVRVLDYYFNAKPEDYDFKKATVIKQGGLLTFENDVQ